MTAEPSRLARAIELSRLLDQYTYALAGTAALSESATAELRTATIRMKRPARGARTRLPLGGGGDATRHTRTRNGMTYLLKYRRNRRSRGRQAEHLGREARGQAPVPSVLSTKQFS